MGREAGTAAPYKQVLHVGAEVEASHMGVHYAVWAPDRRNVRREGRNARREGRSP